jgi:hypothetical protein
MPREDLPGLTCTLAGSVVRDFVGYECFDARGREVIGWHRA